jgi:flagellar biosynthesis component FlhA
MGVTVMKKKRATIVFVIFVSMLLGNMTGLPLSSHVFSAVKAEEGLEETENNATVEDNQEDKEEVKQEEKVEESKKTEEKEEEKVEEKKSTTLKASLDDLKVTVTFDEEANLPN